MTNDSNEEAMHHGDALIKWVGNNCFFFEAIGLFEWEGEGRGDEE